jgi:sigma-B regulation protein RsbU (phosphoserine phosphatase)
MWMRVMDLDSNVLAQAGNGPAPQKLSANWWDRVQKHENLATRVRTPQGDAVSVTLPLHMPHSGHNDDRRKGYVVEVGISMKAVASSMSGLTGNVIIGMLASIALLLALTILALRMRQYVRGKYLEGELHLAKRVQANLQPKPHSVSPQIEFAALAAAADHVGGDFYDVFELEPGKIAIILGDASGKGIPAALLASVLHGAIRSSTGSDHEVTCERINRMLCERTASERFATLFWGIFDGVNSTLRYVNAGHDAPMLLRNGSKAITRLEEGGPVLGCLPDATYSAGELQIHPGDTLILYSDGVTEACNEEGQEFGKERIQQTLATARNRGAAEICEQMGRDLAAFSAGARSPLDDRTLLVVEFSPQHAPVRNVQAIPTALVQNA